MALFAETDTPLPPMEHTGGHKRSQYHPVIGKVICQRILDGETVRQIVADPRMPSYATLFHWRKMHPDFADRYERARDLLADERAARRSLELAHGRRMRAHLRAVAGKPARDWRHGPKSTYRRDWAEAFCERIKAGESGMSVSADPAMPSARCVYRWLRDIPEFRAMYVEARDHQKGWLAFQIDAVVMDAGKTGLAYAKAEVARLEGRIGRLGARTWRRVPGMTIRPSPAATEGV